MGAPYMPPQPYAYYPPPRQRSSGFGVAGLVLGIVGLVLGLIPLLGILAILLGLLAVIFGGIGTGRPGNGMAIAGIVLGILACVAGIIGVAIVNKVVNDVPAGTFDQGKMNQDVRKLVTERFANGKKVENDVSCPAVRTVPGTEADCTLTIGGRAHTAHIVVRSQLDYEVHAPKLRG